MTKKTLLANYSSWEKPAEEPTGLHWEMLTEPCLKTEIFKTQYGEVTYQLWCQLEISRMNKPAKSRYREDGSLCWIEVLIPETVYY